MAKRGKRGKARKSKFKRAQSKLVRNIKQSKHFYTGVWLCLVATLVAIWVFINHSLNWGLLLSIVALVCGFQSLRVMYKNKKQYKGTWLIIPCIIVASLVLLLSLSIHGITFMQPPYEEVSIHNTQAAHNYALELVSESEHYGLVKQMGQPTITELPGDKVMKILMLEGYTQGEITGLSFDTSKAWKASWNLDKGEDHFSCSSVFSPDGIVLLRLSCVIE